MFTVAQAIYNTLSLINRQKKITVVSLFAALTVVGSFIRIPFPYVPLTLQTFFVILSGDVIGPRYGAYSQFLYLILGLIGLPVFAYGGGISYFLQPSFGYLLAYPLGAFVCGTLIRKMMRTERRQRNFFMMMNLILINSIGMLVIFVIGLMYLYLNLRFIIGKEIDIMDLFWSGFIIFIPVDSMKVLLASWLTLKLHPHFSWLDSVLQEKRRAVENKDR
ncbi:biotin transporter BioY [candidate division KSB1 bacterium]|nr:biotin transporter BioY [candidate division KSB1 bacterium]